MSSVVVLKAVQKGFAGYNNVTFIGDYWVLELLRRVEEDVANRGEPILAPSLVGQTRNLGPLKLTLLMTGEVKVELRTIQELRKADVKTYCAGVAVGSVATAILVSLIQLMF